MKVKMVVSERSNGVFNEELIFSVLKKAGYTEVTRTKRIEGDESIYAEVKEKPRSFPLYGISWEVV